MGKLFSFLLTELGQATTYTSLAVILASLGFTMTPGTLQTVTFVGMAVSAVLGIVIKEGWQQAAESGDAIKALEAELAELKSSLPAEKQ